MASNKTALWTNVIALAVLQGAIAFVWIAYRAYLPELFAQVGLPGTETPVSRAEDFMAIALEPMMGFWSDRYRASLGQRFTFVAVGVGIAALILLVVPAIALGSNPVMGVILTVLLVGWAIAMAAFRSPAIALLRQYAMDTEIPQTMGVLLFVMVMVGSFAQPLQDWLLDLGAPMALGGSSLLLVGSAGLMQWVKPEQTLVSPREGDAGLESLPAVPAWGPSVKTLPWVKVGQVMLVGGAIAWGLRLMFGSLAPTLTAAFPGLEPGLAIFAFSFTTALLAVPAGVINGLWGLGKMMMGGAIVLAVTVTGLQTTLPPLLTVVFVVVSMVAWTVMFNGGIPLAFQVMTGDRAGLTVGAYFGGFAGGMALLNWTPLADILETTSSRAGASGIVFAFIAYLAWQLSRPQTNSAP